VRHEHHVTTRQQWSRILRSSGPLRRTTSSPHSCSSPGRRLLATFWAIVGSTSSFAAGVAIDLVELSWPPLVSLVGTLGVDRSSRTPRPPEVVGESGPEIVWSPPTDDFSLALSFVLMALVLANFDCHSRLAGRWLRYLVESVSAGLLVGLDLLVAGVLGHRQPACSSCRW